MEKLALVLATLPPGSFFIYPAANERDVSAELRQQAAAHGIALLPAFRLEEALRQIGLVLSQSWIDNPFRGLEPFEFRHASIFFGRETEIEEVLALLQRRAKAGLGCVLVQGPSGSGKSSLVLAGVVPALLRRDVTDQPVRTFRWGRARCGRISIRRGNSRG